MSLYSISTFYSYKSTDGMLEMLIVFNYEDVIKKS